METKPVNVRTAGESGAREKAQEDRELKWCDEKGLVFG